MHLYPKTHRLRKANDFKGFKKFGRKYSSKYIYAYFKSNNLENTRIAVSVSRRVGNAVYRNKIKRYIREYFRTSIYKNLKTDILFVVDSKIKELKSETLREKSNIAASRIFSFLDKHKS